MGYFFEVFWYYIIAKCEEPENYIWHMLYSTIFLNKSIQPCSEINSFIQQGCNKWIKHDSKDFYNVTKINNEKNPLIKGS